MTKSDAIYENMTRCFNRPITKPETNPQWFTQGLTYLLPKSNETNISKNYGPMTCVSEMYKILTSIVTERIYNFLNANNIPPSEKREYRKGFCGCKGQLLINKMLLEDTRCLLKKCSQLKSGSCFYLICPWLIYWTYLTFQKCFIVCRVITRHKKLNWTILILLFHVLTFFDRYSDKCLSFSSQLSHRLRKYFDEDLMFVVRKKIMVDLIFEILSFRIFHHLFYCNRGFYVYNKYVFGTRFHVRERNLSDFLNHKFTFLKSYFPGDFVRDIYLDKNFENNYGSFGVLYYEEVDRPFILYKFYL